MRPAGRSPFAGVLSSIPPATMGILVACIVIWFVEVGTLDAWTTHWMAFKLSAPGLLSGKIWQLVTYQFVHDPDGVLHVLFNMWALVVFGRRLEARWGTAGFLRYFLACGAGGGVLYVLVALVLRDPGAVVGASGAILGLLVAWALIWPTDRLLLFFVFPIEIRHAVLVLGLIDLMLAWSGAMGGGATGSVAHLGGALTGWLYLAHAWRLRRLLPQGSPWAAAARWWRRRRMKVVDKDFDRWLSEQDENRRH